MKKILVLGAIIAAVVVGAKKLLSNNDEQDEFATDDTYANPVYSEPTAP